MGMKLRTLAMILDVRSVVPIHYRPLNQIPGGMYCRNISLPEVIALKNGTHDENKKYGNKDIGIYIADVTIDTFYDYMHDEIGWEYVHYPLYEVRKKIGHHDTSLAYSIYAILHEVGHHLFFKNCGMSRAEYFMWDKEMRVKQAFLMKMIEDIDAKRTDDDTIHRQIMQDIELYKEIPSEVHADNYAFTNIKERYEHVLNYLKVHPEVKLYHFSQ